MTDTQQEKVVVLTGAGGGIGAATARRFARNGYRLVLSDIDGRYAAPLAEELGAHFFTADVTRETDIEQLVQSALREYGRVDVMINNAGQAGAIGPIIKTDALNWSRTMAVVLDSVFFGAKHAGRAMVEGGRGGVILSTASVAGVATLGPHAYTTAKHAVVALTQSVAAELAAHRIRVNAVAPGRVMTRMTTGVYGNEDNVRASITDGSPASHPLGTLIEADEIAGAFAYLASEDGRNITGQTLVVDSGMSALRQPAAYHTRDPGYIGGDI